jgi:hypothetical protein
MAGRRYEIAKCTSPHCPLFSFRKSTIDRGEKSNPLPEKEHIEASPEEKTMSG